MRSQMVHFARMVPRLRRGVRQLCGELGKDVDFKVYNAEGEMDRRVLERIIPALEHMLRNAIDHGIEAGDQRLAAGEHGFGFCLILHTSSLMLNVARSPLLDDTEFHIFSLGGGRSSYNSCIICKCM